MDYGQRHQAELAAAKRVAEALGARQHRVIALDLQAFGGSALTDLSLDVPTDGVARSIPITYVPARNTIFLSLALAWAEVLDAMPCSSVPMPSTIPATLIAGPNTCRPSRRWQISRLVLPWKAPRW